MKSFPLLVVLLCGVGCWKLSDGLPLEQQLLVTIDGDVPSLTKSSLTDSNSNSAEETRVKRQSSGGAGTGNGQSSGASDAFAVISMILDIGGKGIF